MARMNSPQELEELPAGGRCPGGTPTGPASRSAPAPAVWPPAPSEVIAAFKAEIDEAGPRRPTVDIRGTGCHGFCERGPIVVIHPEEICYLQVTPEDVPEIVSKTIKEKQVVERLLYVDPATGEKVAHEADIPFYKHQERLVFGANRKIDSQSIEDYLAIGGYPALAKALFEMTPGAGHRGGQGGQPAGPRRRAASPRGASGRLARNAPGEPKYVVVNADEGDPGAYMDRSLHGGQPALACSRA